jgi:hypothetical protein
VLSDFADLLGNAANRNPTALQCVGLYATFVATLTGWTGFLAGRWGSPLRWPLAHRLGLAFVGVTGSLAWWWINGAVEGRSLMAFSPTHGLTKGDLLALPALVLAVGVIAVEAAPSRWRRVIETPQPTPSPSSRAAPRSTSVK